MKICYGFLSCKDGVWNAVRTMENLGLHPADERVSFGQIYGMGEQLSIPLGIEHHQNIDKYKIY